MSAIYVDTSALGGILLGEPGAEAVATALPRYTERVSSQLLRVELRGVRSGRLPAADRLLTGIALVPLDDSLMREAELITPANVATLDALHLATAVRLGEAGVLAAVMTYDVRLAEGARSHGLEVIAP